MSDSEVFFPIIKSEYVEREGPRVKIARPHILNIMLHENGKLVTPKNLKYFRNPPSSAFPLNLNKGFDDFIFRTDDYYTSSPRKFETYLMKNNGRELFKNASKQQFCTARNVLKSIMMTPFCMPPKSHKKWSIKAIRFQGVIYMITDKEIQPHSKNKSETYHFKFHQYCFSDSPFQKPDTDEPIDENKQMSCIYRTNIGDFELLYSGEIVGVEAKYPIRNIKNETDLNNCNFVMTKVISDKNLKHANAWKKHPKLFAAWVQATLSRVDKIYIGLRTDNGFVNKEIQPLETRNIPKGQIWKQDVCRRFLRDFLAKVQTKLENIDCPYTAFVFDFDSVLQKVKYRVYEGKTDHSFLSEEFIQYMQKI